MAYNPIPRPITYTLLLDGQIVKMVFNDYPRALEFAEQLKLTAVVVSTTTKPQVGQHITDIIHS